MPAAAAESCRANLVHLTPTHIWFGLKVWFQGLLPEHTIDCPGPIVTNIYIYPAATDMQPFCPLPCGPHICASDKRHHARLHRGTASMP